MLFTSSVFLFNERYDAAHEEVIADAMETILSDGTVMEDLATYDKSIWEKIKDFIVGLIEKIKKAYAELSPNSQAAKVLKETVDDVSELQRLWAEGVREAGERTRTAGTLTRMNEEKMHVSGKKFSFDENFGEQLKDWKDGNGKANGSYNGKFFRLGTTPKILVKHGAPSGEVIMFEDCLLKITGLKHTISLEELSKIPSQLNDPILLFSGSVENSFVALTEIKAKNGHDIVVAVHINKRMGRSVINKIASVYSKTGKTGENNISNYVTQQIEDGNLLDASPKKAPIWFTASGLQLPHAVQTIIDAYKGSISQPDGNVKRKFSISEEPAAEEASEATTAKIPDVSEFEGDTSEKPVKGSVRELLDRVVEGAVESKEDYEVLEEAREKADTADRTKRELDRLYAQRRDIDSRIKELNGIIKAPKNTETLQWAERTIRGCSSKRSVGISVCLLENE